MMVTELVSQRQSLRRRVPKLGQKRSHRRREIDAAPRNSVLRDGWAGVPAWHACWMWVKGGWLVLGLLLGACGGNARESASRDPVSGPSPASAVPNEASGSGNLDAGGASSASGAGANEHAGSGAAAGRASARGHAGSDATAGRAGALPLPHAEHACVDPQPRPRGGGYEPAPTDRCVAPARGNAKRRCRAPPPTRPSLSRSARSIPIDTDCTNRPYGFCAYGKCQYGCVSDDECESDQACYCGPFIGTCVPASCRSDADCPSELPCTGFQAPGFATPDALTCQSPADECVTDAQCNSLNPRVSCKVQVDHRVCYRDPIG